MYYRCAVNFDHVQTVAKDRLGELITTLSDDKMAEAGVAICFALGIEI
ncbi:MAG: type II toxin-antitoxin system PemK/MazF family toxin [Moorella sp. (in: Bacteria)]|nr:type II toxin-antitoxin system PemK/MazF family toxin [Moorella sp. (in: firmicutes)]